MVPFVTIDICFFLDGKCRKHFLTLKYSAVASTSFVVVSMEPSGNKSGMRLPVCWDTQSFMVWRAISVLFAKSTCRKKNKKEDLFRVSEAVAVTSLSKMTFSNAVQYFHC